MLGKTHVKVSTLTASAGLYGLYAAQQSDTAPDWVKVSTTWIIDLINAPIHELNVLPFLIWFSVAIAVVAFGALLPDIDSKRSTLGRFLPFLEDLIGHRTYTHTIWVSLIILGIAIFSGQFLVYMLWFGYTCHIIQDSFSIQGVDVFYPFGKGYSKYGNGSFKNGFHIALYRVGGPVEKTIDVLSHIGHLVLFWFWIKAVMF